MTTSRKLPFYMETPESAKTITVYVNGDQNFIGKKFVVNRKRTPTFDTLLGDVTSGVKAPFGAVRNLYTPVGGTRVLDLGDLSTGKTYVAGGLTKFQKVEYGIKPRPRRARSQDPRGAKRGDEKTLNPIAAQSRFQDFKDTNQKNILVYANGTPRVSFKFLLKSPRSQNLDLILDDVAAKISAKTGYAVRTLYTTQGKKIVTASVIEDGGTYVATGTERFKAAAYGISWTECNNEITAPPSTVNERQPRTRQVKLKPVRVASKDRKPVQPKAEAEKKLQKTTKVHRQGNPLPPIGVATVYQQQTDSDAAGEQVPDDEHMTTEVPIEQQQLEEVDTNEVENGTADIADEEKQEIVVERSHSLPTEDLVTISTEDTANTVDDETVHVDVVSEGEAVESNDIAADTDLVVDKSIPAVNDENVAEAETEVKTEVSVEVPEAQDQPKEDDVTTSPVGDVDETKEDKVEVDHVVDPIEQIDQKPTEEIEAEPLEAENTTTSETTPTAPEVDETADETKPESVEPPLTESIDTVVSNEAADEVVVEQAAQEDGVVSSMDIEPASTPVQEPVLEDTPVDKPLDEVSESPVNEPIAEVADTPVDKSIEETAAEVKTETDTSPEVTVDKPSTPALDVNAAEFVPSTPAEPVVEPAVTEPAVEAVVTEPVVEPAVTEPVVEAAVTPAVEAKTTNDVTAPEQTSVTETAAEPTVADAAESATESVVASTQQSEDLEETHPTSIEEQKSDPVDDTVNVTDALDTVRALSEEPSRPDKVAESNEVVSDHFISDKANKTEQDITVTPSDDTVHQS